MLGELYKYALDNGLVARPGFKQKDIAAYVCFSANGDYLGIEKTEKGYGKKLCPDLGDNTQGDDTHFLVNTVDFILNTSTKPKGEKKHNCYFKLLEEAAKIDNLIEVVYCGLTKYFEIIKTDCKIKSGAVLSFKVDGKCVEESDDYKKWWEDYVYSLSNKKSDSSKKMRCLISGVYDIPQQTIPQLSQPLPTWTDPSKQSLAKLFCMDKEAFCSYGLKRAENSPVSYDTINAVVKSLDTLIEKNGFTIAGAKNIHWFSQQVNLDPVEALNFEFDFGLTTECEDIVDGDEQILTDELRVKKLFKFITSKEKPNMPENRYYMMSLSAYKTRVMIRSYDEGKYDELCGNIIQWYDDISFEEKKYPKLWAFYTKMIKYTSIEKEISEKINNELKSLSPRILYAIMHGTELPDTAAQKVLMYIRSDIYASSNSDENKSKKLNIDTVSCQFLKAWLNRKYRKEKKEEFLIMEKLNENNPSKAYLTGRLMSVYAAIQRKALGDVGAGVIERFYTSACSAPALVMGKLSTMSQYHLSKMEKKDYLFFSGLLQEVTEKIGCSFPKTFSLAEQSEFALGYYQQNAEIYKKKEKTEE